MHCTESKVSTCQALKVLLNQVAASKAYICKPCIPGHNCSCRINNVGHDGSAKLDRYVQ